MKASHLIVLSLMMAGMLLLGTISLGAGQTLTDEADFGDAPDSTNSVDLEMEAYPGVPGQFPTVFGTAAPYGPIHRNDGLVAYLGSSVSGEEGADTGLDSDPDGTNNIIPAENQADYDGADDGLSLPDTLSHCQSVSLEYTVTITDSVVGSVDGFFNLWLDWDRSGTWGRVSPDTCPGWTSGAPEWAVQNHPVSFAGPGTYTLQTHVIRIWNPDPEQEMWLRVTLSDGRAPGDTGAGPDAGFNWGETEDYLLRGVWNSIYLPMVMGGVGDPIPPSPPGVHIDHEEPTEVLASWPQISSDGTGIVDSDDLTIWVENTSDEPRTLEIRLNFLVDGVEYPLTVDPLPTIQAGHWMTDVIVNIPDTPDNSPGVVLGEIHNLLPGTNEVDSVTPIEAIAFHTDESAPDRVVIYTEEVLAEQVSTMDFIRAPGLSGRLASLIPAGQSTADLTQLVFYNSTDPVLLEAADDPDSAELDDVPPPPPDRSPETHDVYYLCPEWYTAPIDNGFGEDNGLNDDGWRARGARVYVWQNGNLLFDGWLNRFGCTAVYGGGNAGLWVLFSGESRLESGGGYINLRYIKNNSTSLKASSTWISNPQDGGVYRPEIHFRDSVGILSYAIQERFNGGVSGEWFYLRQAGCNNDSSNGSCSTSLNGEHIIYMSPGQWRRKFVAGHEYGHKILSFTAGYTNDCSFGGSGHSMNSIEYSSCAAMEGWANFVAADIWNAAHTGNNPGGKLVYWDGSSTVYDVEAVGSECYDFFNPNYLFCDYYGTEKDWMRHWWDFHTNNLAGEPGNGPTHASLFDIVDAVDWENGFWQASDEIEAELSGSMDDRWRLFACWNNITYGACQ